MNELTLDDFKDLDNSEKVNALFRILQENSEKLDDLDRRVQRVEQKLDDAEIKRRKDDRKILDRYGSDYKETFMSRITDAGCDREGLDWKEIKGIFDVKKGQAYNIMADLESDYPWVARLEEHPRDVLVHKKRYLVATLEEYFPGLDERLQEEKGGGLDTMNIEDLVELARDLKDQKNDPAKISEIEDILDAFT